MLWMSQSWIFFFSFFKCIGKDEDMDCSQTVAIVWWKANQSDLSKGVQTRWVQNLASRDSFEDLMWNWKGVKNQDVSLK